MPNTHTHAMAMADARDAFADCDWTDVAFIIARAELARTCQTRADRNWIAAGFDARDDDLTIVQWRAIARAADVASPELDAF